MTEQQKTLSMETRWNIDDHNYVAIAIRNRILPTLLGGIIGDALGVPVEFKNRGSINLYGSQTKKPSLLNMVIVIVLYIIVVILTIAIRNIVYNS